LASKYDVNLNINEKSVAGKAGRAVAGDSAEIKNLANTIKAVNTKQAKDIASSIEKLATNLVKTSVRGAGGSDLKDADFNKIGRILAKELGNTLVRQIAKNLPKGPAGSTDNSAIAKTIERGMAYQSKQLSQTLTRELKNLGLDVDTSSLEKGMLNLMRNAVPKNLGNTIRELNTAANSIKTMAKDISRMVNSVKSMRASGGKVSVDEIGPVISSIKQIMASFKTLSADSKRAKDALSELATESKDLKDAFSKAITELQKETKGQVTGVKSRASEDPKKFAKEIVTGLAEVIKKSDAVRGSNLEKLVKTLEGNKSDAVKISKEISGLRQDILKSIKSGGGGVDSAVNILKDLDKYITKIGNLPKDLTGSIALEIKAVLNDKEIIKSLPKEYVLPVMLEPKDEKLKKAIPKKAEVPVTLKPETKALDKTLDSKPEMPVSLVPNKQAFYKEITSMLPKMEKAARDVFEGAKFGGIKKDIELAIGKDDLSAIRKALDEFTKLKLDLDVGDLKKQVNEFRNLTPIVDAEIRLDTKKALKEQETFLQKAVTLEKKYQIAGNANNRQALNTRAATLPRKDDSLMPASRRGQTGAGLYKEQIIKPGKDVETVKLFGNEMTKQAMEIKSATEANMKRLSSSLLSLQTQIVNTLDKQFEEAGKKWAVVKPGNAKDPSKSFRLEAGNRQWTMQIANLDRLQRATKDFESSVDKLVSSYKQQLIDKRTQEVSGPSQRADLIGQWLKGVSVKQIQGAEDIDEVNKNRLINIKESNTGVQVGEKMRKTILETFGESKLENIFKKTYATSEAKKELQTSGLVKALALPAARTSKTGDVSFQTVHGSQRALPKFVKFQTGFENLYDMLEKAGEVKTAVKFADDVRSVGVRPMPEDKARASEIAKEMLAAVREVKAKGPEGRVGASQFVQGAYVKAGKLKGVDLEKAGVKSVEEFDKEVQDKIASFNKLAGAEQTFDNFVKTMNELNITAFDAVRALSTIKSLNVYDMMNEVLQSGKQSPLKTVGKQPYFERSVREFDKAIGELEGTLPLFESNRPRRAYHQENVTNLLTRSSSFYGDPEKDKLTPAAQKTYIKDLNIEFSDLIKKSERLGKELVGIPEDIRRLSSLGIPESQAGSVEEYRTTMGTGSTKFLKNLQATGIKVYAEDLTELAPFQQFQQAGRNISNVTNAMMRPGAGFETPKLRSTRERDIIQSGRYGKEGYGLNVVAELRNTAANFEDQIVISGKLAKAMTEAVSTLVKPSPLGRTSGATAEERIRGTGVSAITPGEIDKVTKKYMEILGAPEEYKGRADTALIKEVQKAVSIVRGESVEVQQAKLAETFLNYFGRKFTTRYGSKGVSVTPTGAPDKNIVNLLSKYSSKAKIQVKPEDTLGYQVAPKSLGEIATELFSKSDNETLKKNLILAGNKFMVDIFQDAKVVDPAEAKATRELYEQFAAEWQKLFKSEAPKVGIGGIKELRGKAEKAGIETTKIRPIEVRISSYGAAKRGLQTEFMESIFSNLAGAGAIPGGGPAGGEKYGVTTLQKLQPESYKNMLSGGTLKAYSEAIGFKGTGKTEEQLAPELFKTFGGKGDYSLALEEGDKKAVLAKQAAAVEAATSYYSTVIDEFGKERPGLVGEKFLKIIEEPTKNPEWQRGQIERGTKGARLNLPAFSAYSSVFGEESSFMQELQSSLDINANKHWEYMKALQTIQGKDSDIYQSVTKGLKSIDVSSLRRFDKSTGVYDKEMVKDEQGNMTISPRSFSGSILDLEKFPEAFKLQIPTGKRGPAGEIQQEELYIPGAAARGTYDEPLIAGERGMDQITRRMTHVVNMAKDLDTLMRDPEKALESPDINLEETIKGAIGTMIQKANKLAGSNDQVAIDELQKMMNALQPALSATAKIDPKLMSGPGNAGMTEAGFFEDQLNRQRAKVGAGEKTPQKAMAYLVSTLGDLLAGKDPKGGEYDPNAMTGVSRAASTGALPTLGAKLGPYVTDQIVSKRIESLQKAKIEYYNSLAEAATGKSGSINEILFSRKIPAVMGKATTAVVDKKKDLEIFQKRLSVLDEKYGLGLSDQANALSDVAKTHGKAIDKYKKAGIPVLGQEELGIPETFAEKIPLEFLKKYDVGSEGITAKKQPEVVKSTLAGMLKYAEKLREASKGDSVENQQEIEAYINDKLVPYIESIRFPFTGTSSIAPFKPKLVKEGQYMGTDLEGNPRALEKNALMVPGVPEGLEGLTPIIDQVQKRIDSLVDEREKEQTAGAPQEVIAEFTKMIRELNAAISDVIPKYTSQAQKLDFDGDQIEIHAAKTAAARKDIAEHFKRFHVADPKAAISTQDVFMKRFLSEAADIKTTGPNVFGEAAAAFEKKFPSGKGFEFMKSPFLTEDMEYMNSRQALGVMSGNKQLGTLGNVMQQVLTDVGVPEKDIVGLVQQIESMDTGDTAKFTDAIMSLIEKTYKESNSDIFKQIEAGIKKRLYNEKTGDTIEAQLFKIHTGPETEAMYRVHRLGETAAGFGGGLAGGKPNSSEYFKKRFPKMKAMGGKPEEEFHTMINEVLRFGIQKGMDVKHAGDKPVAGEMLMYLTRGIEGAGDLWKRIEDTEDKTFGDLRDFSKDNEKAVRMRLGELPTGEIAKEAEMITSARGGNVAALDGKTRSELIDLIVEKVGLKGFLEEMSILIEKEAVEGLIQQAQEWGPAKRKKEKLFGDDIRGWAVKKVEGQKGFGGINIRKDITEAQAPLYGTRTFSGSPYSELKKFEDRFGQVEPPAEALANIGEDQIKSYKFKYQKAMATASNIQREMKAFAGSKQTGAYADMIRGSMDVLYEHQKEIEMYATSMAKEGYKPEVGKATDMVTRLTKKEGLPTFIADVLSMRTGMKDEVERLSDLAGVPGLSATEKFDVAQEYGKAFSDKKLGELKDSGLEPEEIKKRVEEYADQMVEKVQALKQLDRVADVIISRQHEGRVLQDLMPRGGQTTGDTAYTESRRQQFQRARAEMNQAREPRSFMSATTMARSEDASILPPTAGPGGPPMTMAPGEVVKVHLVGADAAAVVTVNMLKSAGIIQPVQAPTFKPAEHAKVLENVLQKISPEFGPARSTAEYFSPSRIAGGGDAYSYNKKKPKFTEEQRMKEQLDKIIKAMTTEKDMSTAGQAVVDWGSVLHAKIQQYFKDQKNIDIERYKSMQDEVGGAIGGTADLVEYETPEKKKVSKIIDIKSTTSGKIAKLQKAMEKVGSSDIRDIAEQVPDDVKRQLNDYFSQLNTYLKIFDETATAELRFYDKEKLGDDPNAFTPLTVTFDPERFKKDMQQIAMARETVKAAGKPFTEIQNVPMGRPDLSQWPEAKELERAMKEAKAQFDRSKMFGNTRTVGREDDEEMSQRGIEMEQRAAELGKNRMFEKLGPKDLDKYLVPPKIATGNDVESLLQNLETLHDQSKIYQKFKGVDMDAVAKMPEQIGDAIGDVGKKGPDYQSFIDLTGKLKDMERPDFTHRDFINAWKMYRAAVGDYMLAKAREAEDQMRQFEESGDAREASQAYGEFQSRTKRLQEFIRRSIGKPTDLYTDDKRFVYPGLAKEAGVYMSPEQIHGKVGQGLGDDKKLIDTFKTITKGLQESEMPAPLESARAAFADLSEMKTEMVDLLNNAERFGRLGPEIQEAWDFDKLAMRATRLREALQQVAKQSVDMSAEQKKNLENNIKYLKNIEGLYSHRNFKKQEGYGQTGIVPVPKFETPEVQRALHRRNIQSVRQYFTKPAEEGGPEIGERFSYQEKIVGTAGETIKNVTHNFQKYGEQLEMTGQKTGQFTESQQDIIEKMQRVNASFSNAVRRVIMWGAASRLVYGGVSNLKSSLDELASVEVGISQLRMVMSPLETDFGKLSKSATGFAKQYGVPVTDVLKSMKVFAQQGLKQEEVVDRTQTATLASNVTTLNAKEATEALTSAMVIFREEGTQSMRFLDAWSEVEAKHAITADDMANAIKKSAAAAKAAGVSFDQLNGMVAAVGAVTRQTGKEVGTSFRFIFRRLFSEEGPKALAKMNIPTLDEAGELRPAFDILGDLAGQWKNLSSAQKFNVAQAIGGTRQYNSMLVLMENWDDALRGIKNSTNSKGSAERRNAEIMKTYAKQLERTKAAATEFKMEIGKIALPVFTAGTKGLTLLFEALTAIPAPIKIAATALAGFFTLSAQGINIFDSMGDGLNKAGSLLDAFTSSAGKQFDIAKYEVTGKAKPNVDVFGLKTLTPYAAKIANTIKAASDPLVEQGNQMSDFHSTIGKMMFQMMDWGRAYNEMIGGMAVGTGGLFESVGETGQRIGSFLSTSVNGAENIGDILGGLREGADLKGLGFSKVKKELTKEGLLKGGGKLLAKGGAFASEVAGVASFGLGKGLDMFGEGLGAGGQKVLKDFTTQNAGFIKSVAPLALTVAGLIPALKAGAEYFKTMTGSAKDFEASMDGARRKNESQLKTVRDMIDEYDALEKKVSEMQSVQDPAIKSRRQSLGTYEAPLTTLQKTQERAIDLSNQIASSNINQVVGYDKLGNAVLKAGKSFKSYLKDLENLEVRTGVTTELEILTKYLDDLADGSRTEKVKQAFKELADAFPVIGNLVARNIKVSPAKSLEIASEDLNKRLNLKQKYPLSAAADADIKRLQGVLKTARDAYKTTFKDAQRIRGGILSAANLKGLSREQIEDIVKSPELKRAYEAEIKIDPRFKLVDGVKAEDIMGKELLSALNPRLAGKLDVTAELTTANLESAGLSSRQGKAASGDIVTFYKDMADRYDIAGRQAIVKLKDTDEWVVEYFNTRTLQLEERSLSEVENIVEGIFPLQKIEENLGYRMEALNTFVAGAGAGLVGISAKDFKKEFDLGQRFFSDLPTSNILQGNKGFTPGVGYGEIEGMKDFQKDIQDYFLKPMEELRKQTEQFDKLRLEGLETGDVNVSKEFYDEINKLLDILKNNQVVVQFRAVFVDLMKEMSLGQRVLKEEIAIMKRRSETDVVPSGLTAGVPRGLENLDLGVRDIKDITAQQRLLAKSPEFRQGAIRSKELELTSQSNLEMIDKFERATVQLDDILATAQGFGAALKPEDLGKYIEKVVPDREDGPFFELSKSNQGIRDNTADTVDRLDKLLENQGDSATIEKYLSSITDSFGTGLFGKDSKKTTNALERVARIRSGAEGRDDQETVMASNKALDVLTKQLVAQVGYKKGIEMVDNNFTLFSKKFKPEEFQQRAFGGVDTRVFLDKLEKAAPEQKGTFFGGKIPGLHNILFGGREALAESDEFKDFQKTQEKQYKESTFASKNLARVAAVAATLSQIQQSGNKKIVSQLDDQIKVLDTRIEERRAAGAAPKELTGLLQKREALGVKREEKQRDANFYGTVKSLSATKLATTELGRAMGFTETQMKVVGAGAVGLYASMLAASKLMGEALPESAKKFGAQLKELGKKVATGEDIGFFDTVGLKKAGKEMQKDFTERSKEIFGKDTSRVGKTASPVDSERLLRELNSSIEKRQQATEAYREKGPLHAQYLTLMDRQLKQRADLYNAGKQDTPEFKDLVKNQNAEREKFLRSLDAIEKKQVLGDYDKLPGLGSNKEIQRAFGQDIDKLGSALTRGLEAGEAPSKLKQLVAAWLSIAVADYVSGKTADKVALAESEKFAQQQSEALNEVYKKYPDTFEKVLADMQKDADRAVKDVNNIATIDKSLVQDPRKAKAEVQKLIQEQLDAAADQQKKLIEEQRKTQNKAFDTVRKEEHKMSQEQAARDSRSARDAFNITRKYSLQNLMNSALQGYGGDIELPLADQDMSTQQRIYKNAGDGFKGVIDNFSSGVQALDRMRTRLTDLKAAANVEADLAATSTDADVVKMAKERYAELTKEMENQITVIEKTGASLKKVGELQSVLVKFASSIDQLKDALRDVGVQEAVERIPGMEGFSQARDRLLGGAAPDAIVPISTEQERMGSRVGVPLRHMRSTQYDVRRAELMDQMRSAEGEQYYSLERQLNDLPEQERRDKQVYAQRQFDQRALRGLQPYEDLQANLERARIAPGTTKDMRGQIAELQTQIGNTLERALEVVPIDDYIGEIEANRGSMTDAEYKREMAGAKEIKDDGLGYTYRQVPTWEKNVFSGMSDEIKAAIQAAMEALPTPEAAEMKAAIADPITQKIDMTNDILKLIAEKEFGLNVDGEGGIFSKLIDAIKGLFGMSTDKKAAGGHISGPGGPTTDSIPALLSDGEYVVRAASVSKLGTHVLDHINKYGQVPGFADGGYLDPEKYKTGMSNASVAVGSDKYINPEKYKTGMVNNRSFTDADKPSDRDFAKYISRYYNPKENDVPWIKDRFQFEEGSTSSKGRVIHGKFFTNEELGGLENPIFDPVSLFAAGTGGMLAGGLRKATLALSANPQMKQIFRDMGLNFAEGGPASFADYLKEERLKKVGDFSLGSLISQGGLAATEIATRMVTSPLDTLKALGSLDANTVNSMVEGVKERGLFGTIKDIGKGTAQAFMDDLKTGGTGITAGILESMIPAAGIAKAATKAPVKGMTELERVFRNYSDILPGVTGKNIGKVGTADLSALGKAGAEGAYYSPVKAGLGGKSSIMLDKTLAPGKRVDKFTHELFHDFNKESGVLYDYLRTMGSSKMTDDLAPFMSSYKEIRGFAEQLGGKELSSEIISDAFMPSNAGDPIGRAFNDMLNPLKKSGGLRNKVKEITDSTDFAEFRKAHMGFASGGVVDWNKIQQTVKDIDKEIETTDEPMPTGGGDTSFIQGLKDKWSKYREEYDKKQGPAKEGLKGYFINEKAIEEADDISNRKKFDSGGLASLKKIDMSMFEESEPMPTEGDDEDAGFIQGLKNKWTKYKEEYDKKQGEQKKGLAGPSAYGNPKEYQKMLDAAGDTSVKRKKFAPGGEVKQDLDEDGRPIHYYTAYGDDVRSYSNRAEFEAGRKSFKQMGSGKRDLDEQGRPVHYYTAVGDDIRSYANKMDYMAGKRDKYVPVTPELAMPSKPTELYPDPNLPDTKMADLENMVAASRRFEKYRNPEPVTSTKPSDLLLDPNVALAYKSFWGEGVHDTTRYIGKKYDQFTGWLGDKWQGAKDTVSAVADWREWGFIGGRKGYEEMMRGVDEQGGGTLFGYAASRIKDQLNAPSSGADEIRDTTAEDVKRALSRSYTRDAEFRKPIKYGMTDVGRGMSNDWLSLMTTPVDTHTPGNRFLNNAGIGKMAGENVGGEPIHMKAMRDFFFQEPGSRRNVADVKQGISGQTNLIPEPRQFSLVKAMRTKSQRFAKDIEERGYPAVKEAAVGAAKYTGKVAKNVYDMTAEEIAELYGVTLETAKQIKKGLVGTTKEAFTPRGFAKGGPVEIEADYLRRFNDAEDEKERWAIDSSREYMARQRDMAEGDGPVDMTDRKSFMGVGAQFQTDQLARADERRKQFENQLDSYRTFRDTTENNTNKLGAYDIPEKISSSLNRAFNPVSQEELKANLFNRRKDLDFSRLKGPYISQFKEAYDRATDAMASNLAKADEQKDISDWKSGLEEQMKYLAAGGDPHAYEFQKKGLKALRAGRAPILARLYQRKALGLVGDINKEDTTTAAKDTEAKDVKYDQSRLSPGLNKDLQESAGLAGGMKTIFSGVGSAFSSIKDFVKKVIDPFKSIEKEDEKRSATQYHSGGIVAKTGKIFAEAGEVIVPKKLANGGLAEMSSAPSTSAISIDFGDIVSKLESIELRVEEKELKVEEKTFAVEDKTFKVDAPDSIPIDTSNVPKIEVEQPSWMIAVDTDATVKVEQPSWTIPVEVPTDTIKISVDATTAASDLKQAISSAASEIASTLANIDVSGASGNAVGGEAFNQLAQTVSSVSDRLLFVKTDLEHKIKMVGDKQTDSPVQDIDRMINVAITNSVGSLRQEMNNIKTEVSSLGSAQRRDANTLDARLEQIQYEVRIAQNSIGTNGIGRYI
jgi:TP901 family phage tail tape measure protein